ncbi:MAG TPA: hypothetical protein VKS78_04675 [Roseiarcus sp.]|nr:hypothetical protein [Roseiarcus sp.]
MIARRRNLLKYSGFAIIGAALCGVATIDPAPALADSLFGSFVGGVMGGAFGGGYYPYRQRSYGRSGGHSNTSQAPNNAPPTQAESTRALASLAPPSSQDQLAVLKSISASRTLGSLGSSEDPDLIGKPVSTETNRDYTSKIEQLINDIRDAQQKQNSTKEGDITEHAILDSLNEAVTKANLQRFETFLGEDWTPERLRGMILDRAHDEISGLFDGTNRGAVSMNELDTIIKRAARNVYGRLFEVSELLAANRSSTLFVQRLYQIHGDLVNSDTREDAEQLLAQASNAGVAAIEGVLRRDPNSFALRYRAERIIFDCLSDNVETITSADSGTMATPAEIEKRILDTSQQQCSKWVANQLLGADGKLKAQDPMPLRVIWTAEGPKDDPTMYGRATDQL